MWYNKSFQVHKLDSSFFILRRIYICLVAFYLSYYVLQLFFKNSDSVKFFIKMSFLKKLGEKEGNTDLYELSGDEDDRLRKEYCENFAMTVYCFSSSSST